MACLWESCVTSGGRPGNDVVEHLLNLSSILKKPNQQHVDADTIGSVVKMTTLLLSEEVKLQHRHGGDGFTLNRVSCLLVDDGVAGWQQKQLSPV